MKALQYDIYAGVSDRSAKWLERLDDLGSAETRMKLIATSDPGPYFVFCTKTRRVMAAVNTSVVAVPSPAGCSS
jgi:hypothetical protein